jgi:glycosyltransferase involved in cell wall biosynthesis
VTTHDPLDVRSWSGIPYYMSRALARQGLKVEYVGPLRGTSVWLLLTKKYFYAYFRKKRYLTDREPMLSRAYARQVVAQLSRLDVDVVFSPGTVPIASLAPKQPMAFWTDATFAGNVDFYPKLSNLCEESLRNGHRLELAALGTSVAAIYSSDWAAESAVNCYQTDPAKVHVVPFGANIDAAPPVPVVRRLIQERVRGTCKLLFMGVEWERKGGDIAVAVARELNARGIPTELTVVGCAPKLKGAPLSFVHSRGFISKASEEGRAELERLLAETHFLVLPARADCTPIVLCEANAMGVPCITTRVGGIPSLIRDGVNGMTFALNTTPAAYATFIASVFVDYRAYSELALGAVDEYHSRLNWSTSAHTVATLLDGLVRS